MLIRDILIVTESLPPVYGGADIAAYRYFKFLQKNGTAAKILGNHNDMLKKELNVHSVRSLKVPDLLWRYGGYYVSFNVLFVQLFIFLLARPKIKIIHAFNSATLIVQVSVLVARLLRKKVILECSLKGADDPVTLLNPRGSQRHLIMSGKYVQRKIYTIADAYIAKSSYVRSLFENTTVANKLIFEVPYAVATTKYYLPKSEEKIALRRALGLPLDKHIICFAGGINARKGVDILTRSFIEVLKQRHDIFLILIGPTAKYDQLFVTAIKQNMKQVGSAHGVMPGQVSDTYNWMKASDVYVLPSYREGFPISIIESLCCGLITIGSDIPEIQNAQIVNGENGLIFKQGDAHELSARIRQAIEMIDTGNSWTKKSSAEAIEKYRIESVAHRYEKIYDTVLLRKNNK